MKKFTCILLVLAAIVLSSCASGHMPRAPKPMKSGRRHGGSVVMAPVQQQTTTIS